MKIESDKKKRTRTGTVVSAVLAGVCVLIAFAAFYILTVVLSGLDITACAPRTAGDAGMPGKIGSGQFTDASSVRLALGIPLPEAPGVPVTEACVFDDTFAGKTVWRGRIAYECGAVLDIVMPAEAASVLDTDGMTLISGVSCEVCNLKAALCEGDGKNCLLFADENAAYALYMPKDSGELTEFASAMKMTD